MRRRSLLAGVVGGLGGAGASAGVGAAATESACDVTTDKRGDGHAFDVDDCALVRREQRCAGAEDEDDAIVCSTAEGVFVRGLIETPTPCHELALELAPSEDGDCDALTVVITVDGPGEGFCVQCLGVVEYAVHIALEPAPGRVGVVHARGDELAEVTSVGFADTT
jgi:hypothetical protein